MMHCDALVAGAGPAGSAAAKVLADAGWKVLLANPAGKRVRKIGESLPAAGLRLLQHLKMAGAGFESVHRRISGNLSCWGSAQLDAEDFLRSPDGAGWRLDRDAFDASLRQAAFGAGVVPREAAVQSAVLEQGRWQITLDDATQVTARWLLDATGRGSRLSGIRQRESALVALCGYGEAAVPGFDRTFVEAVREGWWYGAVLPDGRAVLALYVRPEDVKSAQENWHGLLAAALHLHRFFHVPSFAKPDCTLDAGSGRLAALTGEKCITMGDAAMTFDPLSSQGVQTAIYSGMRAAQVILTGDPASYEREFTELRALYRKRLEAYYLRETRWPEAPFWKQFTSGG